MAVTELALLRLSHKTSITSPALLAGLLHAKRAMEAASATGQPFRYYHCLEDQPLIYLVGSWHSVSSHMEIWIPSVANQECLTLLQDQLTVDWMFHVGVDAGSVPSSENAIAIGRHFIKEGQRSEFQKTLEENNGELVGYIGGREKLAGGWRIDKEIQDCKTEGEAGREKEEFVLFTGWQSKEEHFKFAETEEFRRHSRIQEWVHSAEIHHAVKIEL